jgi:hypothetical protein
MRLISAGERFIGTKLDTDWTPFEAEIDGLTPLDDTPTFPIAVLPLATL